MTSTVAKRGAGRVTNLGAIGFALAGFTSWVFTDTCIKLVGQSGLPAYEMVAFLGLFMALFLAAYTGVKGQIGNRFGVLRPHRLSLQLARACLDMLNNVCVVIALRHLSLTMFYIMIFTAPMLITVLSAIFLHEGLTWRKSAAVAAGFAGVLIAVNPFGNGRDGDWIGYSACLVCVACFSINMVWSRVLTRTEHPESLAFFSGVVTAVIGFLLMALHLEPASAGAGTALSGRLLMALFGMGLFCALGTLCFYVAVKHTSAANVSQYHYTQLITGTLVTYLVWHTKPGIYVLVGGALIFGSGLYIAVAAREVVGDVVPLTEGN
jgi:drug/metabolite transporter (DMT)-like permease